MATIDVWLTPNERLLLNWLSKEDFSQYGECHGIELDRLIECGLAQVHGPGNHQSLIASDLDDIMFRAVSLTELGLARARAEDGR